MRLIKQSTKLPFFILNKDNIRRILFIYTNG